MPTLPTRIRELVKRYDNFGFQCTLIVLSNTYTLTYPKPVYHGLALYDLLADSPVSLYWYCIARHVAMCTL